jgi:two-component system sensor histidine kinase KdpD
MSDHTSPARTPERGRLKVFLGYAAGVGKTFRMLDEAQQLRAEGRDVVVGYFEPHGRQDTIARIEGLEVIPRRRVEYRGHAFEEMDADAILARRPAICAIDEFPHTNVPGSQRAKRWEDVIVLLDAGIDVLTTMNVQHLESLNDQLREITGVKVRETIPDWVVKEAEEVVLIDLPPRALLNRLLRGVVYPPEKVQRAMESFFKEPTLAALREMAMRLTAHEVDQRHTSGVGPASLPSGERVAGSPRGSEAMEARERILIHVTDSPGTAALIRRGRRVADYLKGDCFAVSVVPRPPAVDAQGAPGSRAVAEHLDFARRLHIETRTLVADDEAHALVAFARANAVTQVFLPRPARRLLSLLSRRHTTMRVVALAHDMQVTVAAERKRSAP